MRISRRRVITTVLLDAAEIHGVTVLLYLYAKR